MNLDYVKKRDGKKVKFKSEKIENAVLKAAAAVKQSDPKIAAEVTAEVLSYLKIFFKNGGTAKVEQIQDLVEKVLIEKGYAEIAKAYILYREQHSKLRDSKKLFADAVNIMDDYLDRSDWKVNENSNMSYSLQGLNNFIASEVTGQYWLQEIYPEEAAELHSSGDLHIHDLGNLSVYCCGWDLEDLLRTGFRGVSTKIESAPPKHLKTALGQIVNFFYTLQGEASGAQAFSNFDTYLAPFIAYDNLNYEEVKQAMQEFLFNMNVPTRVGFQSPFTNITMDLKVPSYLKEQAVIIGGQYQEKCYGEFQEEMDMLNRAFAELMMEGDAKGRMFSFPIPTYNISKDFEWENEKLDPVWKMTAKFGIPYFCLSENTIIITDKGSKQLKNININKDKVLGDDGNFYSITNLFKNNHKEYIKIITEKQQKIECSKNHKFPTDNGLKKAEDLSLNDKLQEYGKQIVFENGFILSYENQHLFDIINKSGEKIRFEKINKNEIDDFYCLRVRNRERKKIDKFNYKPNRFQTTLKDIKIPQKLDKDIFEMIGQLLGDGYLPKTKNSIRLASNDSEIIDFFVKTINDKFDLDSSIYKAGSSETCLDVNVNSKILKEFLKHIGLKFGRGDEKEIPQIIYKRNDEEIGALLRGLFDTDGSISINNSSNPIITLTLKNRKLLQQVLELLMFLGIAAYYKSSRKKYGEIRIHGEKNIKLFKDKIGFSITRKACRLIEKDSNKPNLGDKIITKKQSLNEFGKDFRQYKEKDIFRVKKDTDGIYLFVNKIKESNNYVEIKSLSNIKKEISTVDIHVNSENHLFTLKNNVVVHNSNFINSDMDPEDARSMAILGAQEVIYKNQNGDIAKNEIRHLVNNWIEAPKKNKPDYKMLMDGKFVDIIDMFEVPYENYSTYINIELENGYKQSFSYEHKCAVIRNGEFKEIESQDLLIGDEFLLSKKGYNESFIGNYKSGKILGYYLGEGWINSHSKGEICFAININRKDIVNEIKEYFNEIACKVKITKIYEDNIYKINIYGRQALGFVKNYIRGKKATTKRLNNFIWNTSVEFRTGIVDGLYETDGHKNKNILFHTTNKKLAEDLITLVNTIGKSLKYRENNKNTRYFKQDKSDKETFTSYELKFKDDYDIFKLDNSNFDLVKITNIREIGTKTDKVYNFTVDTRRHLYELPNGIITHQCCRLRLDNKELRKRGGGLFGANPLTGSIGVATLNMARIGYQAQTKEEFMERVYYLMDQAKESLEIKRKVLENLTEQGLYPYTKFYLRDIKKRFDQYWKNHFNTIGLNGMNEALLNFLGEDISTPAGQQFSQEVMGKMREHLQQYQEETDNLYNLEATPAESTAYRFARLDREKFGNQIIAANQERVVKEEADPYYTNSTQLPVGLTDDIFTALELQDEIQSLYTGGCIESGNKVLTNKGAIKIEKIVRDFEKLKPIKALSYNPKKARSEWDLITDAMSIDVSKNNKIRVTAEKGLDITTSDWHPFFVLEKISVKNKCPICGEKVKGTKSFSTHTRYNPECRKKYKTMVKFKVVEKRADELNIGDYILQNSENLYPEKKSLLDSELMWLFGYFMGDGSISEYEDNRGGNHIKKYKLRFNDEHWSNLEKAKKIINNKFNTDISIMKNDKRSKKLYELATTMYSVSEFFLNYGFFSGEKCYEVNIPEKVKANITKNNVYSLLSGLIDSDGHINKKHGDIEYYTVSEKLADDIVEILSTAGIMVSKEDKPSKRKNEVDGFRIRIPAQQATKIKNKLTITNDADFIKDKLSLRKRRQLPVVRVKNTSKIEVEDNQFYDLTTEKNHNYLAGNRTMVFIHNTVFHGFLGEKIDSIKATKKLVKRIAENFKLPYYTLTPSFSICPVHGYLPGEHEYCPKCEAEAEARENNNEKSKTESEVE